MKRRIRETSSRLFVMIVMALGSILVMGGLWAAGGDLFWEDQSDKGHGPLLVPFAEASEKPGGNPGGVGADCTDPPNLVPGADLVNCNITLGPLRDANLQGTNLTRANLQGAIMYNAKLRNVDLSGASLISADLTGANLTDADLTDADLTFARLGATLMGANLTDANLTNSDLAFANLTEANLTDANLTGANMRGANLTDANVAKARWSNTTCPDGTNSSDPDGDGGTCLTNF